MPFLVLLFATMVTSLYPHIHIATILTAIFTIITAILPWLPDSLIAVLATAFSSYLISLLPSLAVTLSITNVLLPWLPDPLTTVLVINTYYCYVYLMHCTLKVSITIVTIAMVT